MGFESNPVYFTLQFATVLSAADYSKTVAVLVQKYKYWRRRLSCLTYYHLHLWGLVLLLLCLLEAQLSGSCTRFSLKLRILVYLLKLPSSLLCWGLPFLSIWPTPLPISSPLLLHTQECQKIHLRCIQGSENESVLGNLCVHGDDIWSLKVIYFQSQK